MNPNTRPEAIALPTSSRLHAWLPGAWFADSYRITLPPALAQQPPLALFLHLARGTPGWVNALMRLRNQLAGWVGLKNLGGLGDIPARPLADWREGDRIGIFKLLSVGADEVILGDCDKHLEVRLSLHRLPPERSAPSGTEPAQLAVSTVVQVHNRLGRLYMALITPFHRLIVRRTLAQLAAGR